MNESIRKREVSRFIHLISLIALCVIISRASWLVDVLFCQHLITMTIEYQCYKSCENSWYYPGIISIQYGFLADCALCIMNKIASVTYSVWIFQNDLKFNLRICDLGNTKHMKITTMHNFSTSVPITLGKCKKNSRRVPFLGRSLKYTWINL